MNRPPIVRFSDMIPLIPHVIKREGEAEAREEGVKALIETCKEFGRSKEETKAKVAEKFKLKEKAAEEYMRQYWL